MYVYVEFKLQTQNVITKVKYNIDSKMQELFYGVKVYSTKLFPKAHVIPLHCVLLYCHPQYGTSFSVSETATVTLTTWTH